MPHEAFQAALTKLVNDGEYRTEVATQPTKLRRDFDLSPGEAGLLLAVGEAATGTPDVSGYQERAWYHQNLWELAGACFVINDCC